MFYRINEIADDIMSPTALYLQDRSEPLIPTSVGELSQGEDPWLSRERDRPDSWFPVDHETFGIYPRPGDIAEVIRVDYYAWPQQVTDDVAIIDLDDYTVDAVIQYVIYLGLMKRYDVQRAIDIFAQFASLFREGALKDQSNRLLHQMIQRTG
jgi:hypothetical protein